VEEYQIEWSLRTKGEEQIEMAHISKETDEWEWTTFFFSTSPEGADEIESGWTSSLKEAKEKVKESLLKAGVIKK
jgi:hypothetical protein